VTTAEGRVKTLRLFTVQYAHVVHASTPQDAARLAQFASRTGDTKWLVMDWATHETWSVQLAEEPADEPEPPTTIP
jgi:hypothetical protein